MKNMIISTKHSTHLPKRDEKLKVSMEGGSPYFAYIWIDDQLYTVIKGERTFSIKRTK